MTIFFGYGILIEFFLEKKGVFINMEQIRVKIFGAGSIGNHLSQACRRMGWQVTVVDPDPEALKRMKRDIYPARYGVWDENIELFLFSEQPRGDFDVIFLGTPPHIRMALAREILEKEAPKVLQLEKPIVAPDLESVEEFLTELRKYPDTKVVTGYDHAVSKITHTVEEIIRSGNLGTIRSLDVEFREHWGGIFDAHPWLKGPQDTYLGFWRQGGGASGEHSHATNIWQHFVHLLGQGRVIRVTANLQMVKDDKVEYDQSFFVTLETEKGFLGRVVQDVIRKPTLKEARFQFEKGFFEWIVGYGPEGDLVRYGENKEVKEHFVPKKRPDDFYQETLHIKGILDGKIQAENSPISLERGLNTMLVIAAAHKSHQEKRTIEIDYSKGYTLKALK